MQGVIFDIDGTLVESFDFDGECYRQAVVEVMGDVSFRSDWGDYPFVTDEGILRQICSDNALVFEHSRDVRSRFGQLVAKRLSLDPTSCTATPGACALVERLRVDPNFQIGFATGGWCHTAHLKLDHVGISHARIPCRSSDDSYDRIAIMESCRAAIECSPDDVVYVGDGEWDMRATKALGWRFIGIGSRLKNQSPVWIPDFESCDFQALIGSL